jgi:hypothetical protein
VVAAACTRAVPAGQFPAAAHPASRQALAPQSPAASARLALEITPAAYQLPSGIAREVVLAQGSGLLIAGGLTQRAATTDAIAVLDPATGKLTLAGRLATPTHDAAGAIVAGRPYVFGGGVRASAAGVQALGPHRTATVTGRLPGPRSDSAALTLGDTAYLLGGYDGTSYDANVLATTDGDHFRTVARQRPAPVTSSSRSIWPPAGRRWSATCPRRPPGRWPSLLAAGSSSPAARCRCQPAPPLRAGRPPRPVLS